MYLKYVAKVAITIFVLAMIPGIMIAIVQSITAGNAIDAIVMFIVNVILSLSTSAMVIDLVCDALNRK